MSGHPELKALNLDQARFVALLAKEARVERDEFIGRVPDKDLAGRKSRRSELDATVAAAAEVPLSQTSQLVALREAITTLSPEGRSELYALMRIGQGNLAAQKWHRGLTEATTLGDETVAATLLEDPDLHDHLAKGLFEANLVPR